MNTDLKIRERLFEQIASMEVRNVPNWQIAQTVGLDDSRISQIQGTDDYRKLVQEKQAVIQEQNEELTRGWRAVEEESVGVVLQTLQQSIVDPDFAAKMAVAANKVNSAANYSNSGKFNGQKEIHAVIKLPDIYINSLHQQAEQGAVFIQSTDENNELKSVDQMPIDDVQKLVEEKDDKVDLGDLFAATTVS